jgi:4-amino-4-deoxy-L-arabinose transferase-like glycosyltransferase
MALFDVVAVVFGNNDKARFPVLARDILARGDWWFPTLNGVVYQNKPLLFAWLIAAVSWPFGQVSTLTGLAPTVAAAVGLALVVYAAGRDMFGSDAGRAAGVIVAMSQGFVTHARLAMPDMLLTFCLAFALWQGWRLTRKRRWARVGFYGATGLAFWSKGPAGLLPLAIMVAWALTGDRRRRLALLRLPSGLALLAVIVAPWPLIGLLGHPEALRSAVVTDQLAWYARRDVRLAAVLAPLQNAFGILFPWVLLTPLILAQALRITRGRGAERDSVGLLLVWSLVTFVAVGLSSQQRVRYYLPLLPPMALLTGWWVASVVVWHRAVVRIPWRVYGVVGGALAVAGALSVVARREVRVYLFATWLGWLSLALLLSVVGLAAVLAVMLSRPRQRRGLAFAFACVAAAVAAAGAYRADLHRPTGQQFRRLEARVQRLAGDTGAVVTWDVADLPLSFYLRRPVLKVHSGVALTDALEGQATVAVVAERTIRAAGSPDGTTVLGRSRLGTQRLIVLTNGQ